MWGIRTTAAELARTLFLAVSIFGFVYALLFASYGIFHTDFRFTFVSAPAAFPVRMLLVALEYIPLIFIPEKGGARNEALQSSDGAITHNRHHLWPKTMPPSCDSR